MNPSRFLAGNGFSFAITEKAHPAKPANNATVLHRRPVIFAIESEPNKKDMKKAIFAIMVLSASLTSCKQSRDGNGAHAEEPARHDNEIVFDRHKAESAGLEYETVRKHPFKQVIAATVRWYSAPGKTKTVVAPDQGVVAFAESIAEGSHVEAGEKLFSISSGNLQDGDPVEKAGIEYETARKQYERAKKLAEDDIISQSEMETAAYRFQNAEMAYKALGSDGDGAVVNSPCTGDLSRISINDGDFVSMGQTLATVTDNRRIRLVAQVPARFASDIDNLSGAKFKASHSESVYDSGDLDGEIIAISKNLENSPYVTATLETDNPGNLMPGSFAEIWLYTGKADETISLPYSAITEEQGTYSVFVQVDEDCYKKKSVVLGGNDGERVEILDGLAEGDKVVTDGGIHLKLAASAGVIPGHTHNH